MNGTAANGTTGGATPAVPRWRGPAFVYVLTGGAQGFAFAWALPFVVWLVIDLKLSPLRLVLLGVVAEGVAFVAEIPTGVLADNWSRKWSVCLSYALMGLAMALMPLSANFGVMLCWQVLWALGEVMESGATTAWVSDELGRDVDDLIVANAKWRQLGLMVGLPVVMLLGWWSVVGSMVVLGVIVACFAAFLAAAMRQTFVPGAGGASAGSADAGSSGADAGSSGSGSAAAIPAEGSAGSDSAGMWRDAMGTATVALRAARGHPLIIATLVSVALWGCAYAAIDALDTPRVTSLGLPDASDTYGVVFFGIVWFAMTVANLPAMYWLQRRIGSLSARSLVRLLVVLMLLMTLGTVTLGVGSWLVVALIGWTIGDVSREVTWPLTEALVNARAPSEARATVVSFVGWSEHLGNAAGGIALGVVAEVFSISWALVVAACVLALAAAPFLFGARALRRRGWRS